MINAAKSEPPAVAGWVTLNFVVLNLHSFATVNGSETERPTSIKYFGLLTIIFLHIINLQRQLPILDFNNPVEINFSHLKNLRNKVISHVL